MSILERLRRLARANINDLLDRAEAPESALKQKIRDLEGAVDEAKQALGAFAATFKKTEREQEQCKRLRDEWQHKAEAALKADDESLARRALSERLSLEERITSMDPAIARSRAIFDELKENIVQLKDQLRNTRLRLSELQSRHRTAEAQKALGKQMDRAADNRVGDGDFDRFEDQVVRSETEAEVDRELRNGLADVEQKLNEKERSDRIEDEFKALKDKLGK